MEEEKKVEETTQTPARREIKFSMSLLFMLFALTALALFVIVKICAHFGVMAAAFYGVMSIMIYSLSFVGMVLSYFMTRKLSPEFWANLGVLALTLAFM